MEAKEEERRRTISENTGVQVTEADKTEPEKASQRRPIGDVATPRA
jgi:hypothetical protein